MNVFLYLLIALVLFVFLALLDDFKKGKVKKYFESKKIIIDIISKLFIGVITIFIAMEANNISKRHIETNLAETSPSFSVIKVSDFENKGIEEAYKLNNKKGIASYVNFRREDRYSFTYKNKQVDVNIDLGNNVVC